jgi:hypothetical protein
VDHADHLLPLYLQCCTGGDGSDSCEAQSDHSCERLLSNEVADGKKGDGRHFTVLRNNSLFCTTALKIEDRVRGTSLREEGLLWFQFDDSSSQASSGQKRESVKCHFLGLCHLNDPFQKAIMPGQFRRACDRFRFGLTAGILHPL